MKNKISDNNNMAISKNQKIRNQALQLLRNNKNKFNPRTYTALEDRIKEKRILRKY